MTKYQFLIKYFEITKSDHHWVNGEFWLCGKKVHCLDGCKITKFECDAFFGDASPSFTKRMIKKFQRNYPEKFI